MANIYLDANDTFTLPSTNTDDKVFGRAGGNETIILQGNPSGTVLDGNIEVVQVASSAANTTLQVNATTGLLELVSGSTVFATFSGGLNGPVNLQFTDGNVTLTQTGANSFSIANPTNATNNVTISSTTSQTGSAVTLGPDQSTAGPSTTPTTPGAFTVTTSDAAEGSTATFTVTRDGDTSAAATVDYAVSLAGGATAADHGTITAGGTVSTTGSGTLSFAAGEASKTITIPVTADIVTPEAGEGITVTLTNPTGGTTLGTAAATSTILDDPSIGTLTQNATSVTEGQTATYTLTLKAPATTDTVVSFTVAPGDASAANQGTSNTNLNDFAQGSFNPQTVTIAAGSTTATFALDTTDDSITELPENYTVSASIGGNTVGTVTTSLLDSGGAQGQTFTLTTGADNPVGTGGPDTFIGVIDDNTAANNTLTVLDTLTGGPGTDTLNVIADASGAALSLPPASITGIENLFFRNISGQTLTVDANLPTGEEQLWADRSTNAIVLNNVGSGTTVGVNGNGVVINGGLNANFVAGATTGTLVFAGGTKDNGASDTTITGAGLTSFTIKSTGAANETNDLNLVATVKAVTIDAATNLTIGDTGGGTGLSGVGVDSTLTITGAGAVTHTDDALAANFDTVDASANTGGVALVLDAEADTKFTGGSGNDAVTTGAVLTSGSANAGAGTDTLTVSDSTHLATSALGAKYTNFETLGVTNGVSVDLDNITGITAVEMTDGASALTELKDLNATQAGAVTIKAGDGAAIIGVKGAATPGQIDTVKMTFNDGDTTLNEDINNTASTFTLAGVENLEVTAVDQADIVQSNAASGDLTGAKLMGAGNISFVTGNMDQINFNVDGSTATGMLTVDASGFALEGVSITGGSGNDALSGSDQGDVISGGAGNDTIDGNDGDDVLTGGAGVDTFKFAGGDSSGVASATVFQTINDFNTGGSDIIDWDVALSVVQNGTATGGNAQINAEGLAVFAGSDTTLIQQITAAEAAIAATGNADGAFAFWANGSDSYVFISDGVDNLDANDVLVKLVGVTGLTDSTINGAGDITIV